MKNLLKPLIILFMALLFINLVWTVAFFDTAPLYWISNLSSILVSAETNTTVAIPVIDKWAIRGQIGDIMSGHFSALAFLAVALSIIYQSEANQQMKKSIDKQEEALEQQSKALGVQSTSLEAQIEELQQSRKESSKHTEEFFINNMNVKLDRYYKFFDEQVIKIYPEKEWDHITKITLKILSGKEITYQENETLNIASEATAHSLKILEHIFGDIQTVKEVSKKAYQTILDEYKLRLQTDSKILLLCLLSSDETSYKFFTSMNMKRIDKATIKVQAPIF